MQVLIGKTADRIMLSAAELALEIQRAQFLGAWTLWHDHHDKPAEEQLVVLRAAAMALRAMDKAAGLRRRLLPTEVQAFADLGIEL